jgi:hypothetical protein
MAPSLLIPDADIDAGLVILEAAVRDITQGWKRVRKKPWVIWL